MVPIVTLIQVCALSANKWRCYNQCPKGWYTRINSSISRLTSGKNAMSHFRFVSTPNTTCSKWYWIGGRVHITQLENGKKGQLTTNTPLSRNTNTRGRLTDSPMIGPHPDPPNPHVAPSLKNGCSSSYPAALPYWTNNPPDGKSKKDPSITLQAPLYWIAAKNIHP